MPQLVAKEKWEGRKLVSLLQIMYEYKVGDLALMFGTLNKINRDLSTSDQLGQPICTDEFIEQLGHIMNGLAILCTNFRADRSLIEQIKDLERDLKSGSPDRREGVLLARTKAIENGVQNNLNDRKFMFMPPEEASYWNNFDIFGKRFVLSFPQKAALEMLEAGRCFAAARGTACVFHCMRVAEYGLRKLAGQLHVKIADRGQPIPIEYGDWNKVITAIRNKIATIRQRPTGPKREKLLQGYSRTADHCDYLKDIWRNELMHTRRFYDQAETLGVINRVREFIEPLLLEEKDARQELQRRAREIQGIRELGRQSRVGSTQRTQEDDGRGKVN